MKLLKRGLPGVIVLLSLLLTPISGASAQVNQARRPVDMLILVDNSCSMFPQSQILQGCDVWGHDPGFLRIVGADLFLARLGFAEANEDEYQAGVISLGDDPVMVSPLQPLSGIRDSIAAKIANPRPQLATKIVPALELAYKELETSPNRRAANLPAIVLLTDGIPYPPAGQSEKDIETLITGHADVPLFVLLLQGQDQVSKDYQRYIEFWQDLATRSTSIFVYLVRDANQIQETYNGIIGQLQNTIPTRGIAVAPDKPLKFYVSSYLQKVVVTAVRPSRNSPATIQILDAQGKLVDAGQEGVGYFRGKENPVEVISVAAPRLADELKNAYWTVTSDTAVTVLVDREGSYRINFIEPTAAPTEVTNVFRTAERQSPTDGLALRFNLLDAANKPVLEAQKISGEIISPDGKALPLPELDSPEVAADGIYTLRIDMLSRFPELATKPGRYTLLINAGSAEVEAQDQVPISTARLIVDMGRIPFIRNISPQPLACGPGWLSGIRVSVGDFEAAQEDGVRVQVIGGGKAAALQGDGSGTFSGDLTPLCEAQLAQIGCGGQVDLTFSVALDATLADGTQLAPAQKDVPVQAMAPACTPTPQPTPTDQPPPAPTPIPDRDGDGVDDLADRCPDTYGWSAYGGCLPLTTLLWMLEGLVLAGAFYLWGWPWIKVRTVSAPPAGYLLVCRGGLRLDEPVSLYERGMARRTDRLRVGGDRRRADIYVAGLKSVEFVIERRENQVAIRDPQEREPFEYFDETVRLIRTSDPKVILKVSLNVDQLSCG